MAEKPKATSGHTGGQGNDLSNLAAAQPHYSTNGADLDRSISEAIEGAFTSAADLAAESRAEAAELALLTEGAHDEGNARCTHAHHAGRFVYSEALGWLHHKGSHWAADGAEAAVDRAIVDTLTARATTALHSGQAERYDKLIKFCIPNKTRVQGAKYLLSSLVATSRHRPIWWSRP